jgi:diacylglycerol kinase (ATP)
MRGVEATVCVSQHEGHAFSLAREAVAAGARLVCAWGGDGTLNEVGTALVDTGIPVAVIPAGSGNGFARELGISLNPELAFGLALSGHDRLIDAGEISGRLFFNVAGMGLDARIAAVFNSRAAHRRGFLRYVGIGLHELMTYRPGSYRIEADGHRFNREAIMVVLANLRQYGNGAYIAPQAEPDDGCLDLVVVEARSNLRAFLLTWRLFAKSLHHADGILTRRASRVTISSNTPLLCHVDGEAFDAGREVTAIVRPRALKVRVPISPTSSAVVGSGTTAGCQLQSEGALRDPRAQLRLS